MKYRIKNNKYIIEKDGIFFSLTFEQIKELQTLLDEIMSTFLQPLVKLE